MTSKTPRRAVLAGAAALPALAVPALASATDDPIFAAIERHRQAEAKYVAVANTETADEDGVHDLCDKSWSAYARLVAMTPTTAAGCAAMLRYVEQHEAEYGEALFDNCANRVRLPGKDLLSRVASALDGKAVQS